MHIILVDDSEYYTRIGHPSWSERAFLMADRLQKAVSEGKLKLKDVFTDKVLMFQ